MTTRVSIPVLQSYKETELEDEGNKIIWTLGLHNSMALVVGVRLDCKQHTAYFYGLGSFTYSRRKTMSIFLLLLSFLGYAIKYFGNTVKFLY